MVVVIEAFIYGTIFGGLIGFVACAIVVVGASNKNIRNKNRGGKK